LDLRKNVFLKEKKEEFVTSINQGVTEVFPMEISEGINHYHRFPNEMDRLRWLGQHLVRFFMAEWLYETQANTLTGRF